MSEQQSTESHQRKGIQLPRVSRPWVPAAVGYATALVGLGDIVGAVAPHFRGTRVHELASLLPGTVTRVATAASLVVGILLIMLAYALRRRKRRAWQAVAVLLPVGFLLEALRWWLSVDCCSLMGDQGRGFGKDFGQTGGRPARSRSDPGMSLPRGRDISPESGNPPGMLGRPTFVRPASPQELPRA